MKLVRVTPALLSLADAMVVAPVKSTSVSARQFKSVLMSDAPVHVATMGVLGAGGGASGSLLTYGQEVPRLAFRRLAPAKL